MGAFSGCCETLLRFVDSSGYNVYNVTVQYIYCPPSFCSTQHQSLHEEAGRCLPFTITRLEGVGRCAVATRDIQPGELIFR